MQVEMCPVCYNRMQKDISDKDFILYICHKCGSRLTRITNRIFHVRRNRVMQELGIESYRILQGGELDDEIE